MEIFECDDEQIKTRRSSGDEVWETAQMKNTRSNSMTPPGWVWWEEDGGERVGVRECGEKRGREPGQSIER